MITFIWEIINCDNEILGHLRTGNTDETTARKKLIMKYGARHVFLKLSEPTKEEIRFEEQDRTVDHEKNNRIKTRF
jgi:hypothetical protein